MTLLYIKMSYQCGAAGIAFCSMDPVAVAVQTDARLLCFGYRDRKERSLTSIVLSASRVVPPDAHCDVMTLSRQADLA